MKFLISLIVLLPTLISILLFVIAGLSFNAPELLAASSNPTIAICCIIAGIIALVPLLAAPVILLMNFITSTKNKKSESLSSNDQR